MSTENTYLDVTILGRDYRVACQPAEREALLAAVALVDDKMREIAQRTKSTMAERVAVMAALNLAHELLEARNAPPVETVDTSAAKRRIEAMGARLEVALASQQQLEI